MAKRHPKFKKFLKVSGWALGVSLALLALLPVWFPWVLQPVLGLVEVHCEGYERVGYLRFKIHRLIFEQAPTRVEVKDIDALLPPALLWRRYAEAPATASEANMVNPAVQVGEWSVIVSPVAPGASPRTTPPKIDSTAEVLDLVEQILQVLRGLLPDLKAGPGRVRWEKGGLDLPSVNWLRGQIEAELAIPGWDRLARVRANFAVKSEYPITAMIEPEGVEVNLICRGKDGVWMTSGEARWEKTIMTMAGRFVSDDWWPGEASFLLQEFRLPAASVHLRDYEEIAGHAELKWKDRTYELGLTLRANPGPNAKALFDPVDLQLRARGDLQTVEITQCDVSTPWLQSGLSKAETIPLSSEEWPEPLEVEWSLDLDTFRILALRGQLLGRAWFRPRSGQYPEARFSLNGTRLQGYGLEVEALEAAGRLNWPLLEVDRAEAKLPGDSSAMLNGKLWLSSNWVEHADWRYEGKWLQRYVTNLLQFQSLKAEGSVEGAVTNLLHGGELIVGGVTAPWVHPLDLQIRWQGAGFQWKNLNVRLSSGETALELRGEGGLDPEYNWRTSFALIALDLQNGREVSYKLARPAHAVFEPRPEALEGGAETFDGGVWRVAIDSLDWRDGDQRLFVDGDVKWPLGGRADISAQRFDPGLLGDLLDLPRIGWRLDKLDLQMRWDQGPLEFTVDASAGRGSEEPGQMVLNLRAQGNGQGIRVETLRGWEGDSELVSGQGRLPLVVLPAEPKRRLRGLTSENVDFDLKLASGKEIWEGLARRAGLKLEQPEARLQVNGAILNPSAQLVVQARQVAVDTNRVSQPMPPLTDVRFIAAIDRDAARLETLSFFVEDHPVTVSGTLPLGGEFWADLPQKRELPDWRLAEARLETIDLEISRLARYLPKIISPQGQVDLVLRAVPGGTWDGRLVLTNAASRPMPPVGPIRDIYMEAVWSNRTVRLEQFAGRLGGQPVTLGGEAVWKQDGHPFFDLRLQGENVPMVREPNLILRGDMDIRLLTLEEGRTNVVAGTLELRPSLYLENLRIFLPGGVAQPSRRPPYFSVEAEPYADWRLDLKIKGDRFLQVRNPLFRGVLSTVFQLGGTLKDPLAIGTLRADDGRIQFPFGLLTVEQGMVSLTSENPYQPQAFVIATGRNFGYDVTMEVTGPLDNPVVLFSSRPPLNSEQVILMLTAGEIPNSDLYGTVQGKGSRAVMFFGRDFLSWLGADSEALERLSISTGQEVSEQGRPTYDIEYRLNDRWSVVGEYDRFNEMNVGVKWRIYSK